MENKMWVSYRRHGGMKQFNLTINHLPKNLIGRTQLTFPLTQHYKGFCRSAMKFKISVNLVQSL